jgi:hypothetical protein
VPEAVSNRPAPASHQGAGTAPREQVALKHSPLSNAVDGARAEPRPTQVGNSPLSLQCIANLQPAIGVDTYAAGVDEGRVPRAPLSTTIIPLRAAHALFQPGPRSFPENIDLLQQCIHLPDGERAELIGKVLLSLCEDLKTTFTRRMDVERYHASFVTLNNMITSLSEEARNAVPHIETYLGCTERYFADVGAVFVAGYSHETQAERDAWSVSRLADWQYCFAYSEMKSALKRDSQQLPNLMERSGLGREEFGWRGREVKDQLCTLAVVGPMHSTYFHYRKPDPSEYAGPVLNMLYDDDSVEARQQIIEQLPLSADQARWVKDVDPLHPTAFPGYVYCR